MIKWWWKEKELGLKRFEDGPERKWAGKRKWAGSRTEVSRKWNEGKLAGNNPNRIEAIVSCERKWHKKHGKLYKIMRKKQYMKIILKNLYNL